jgi:hypothetical protein
MRSVLTFVLFDLATGDGRFALICQEARYASIASPGVHGLERRLVTRAAWREFEAEVTRGLDPGPLAMEHIVSRILIDERQRMTTTVDYVSSQPLEFDAPSAALRLDAHLWAMASRGTL